MYRVQSNQNRSGINIAYFSICRIGGTFRRLRIAHRQTSQHPMKSAAPRQSARKSKKLMVPANDEELVPFIGGAIDRADDKSQDGSNGGSPWRKGQNGRGGENRVYA